MHHGQEDHSDAAKCEVVFLSVNNLKNAAICIQAVFVLIKWWGLGLSVFMRVSASSLRFWALPLVLASDSG